VTYAPVSGPPYDVYTIASGAVIAALSARRAQTSALPATYAFTAACADAWAQAFDTAWDDSASIDELQAVLIWEGTVGFWATGERVPTAGWQGPTATLPAQGPAPSQFAQAVDAIIQQITAAEDQFAAEGITPAPWRGGSAGPFAAYEILVGNPNGGGGISQYPDFEWDDATGQLLAGTLGVTALAGANAIIEPLSSSTSPQTLVVQAGPSTSAGHTGGAMIVAGGPNIAGGNAGTAHLRGGLGTGGMGNAALDDPGGVASLTCRGSDGALLTSAPLTGDGAGDTFRTGVLASATPTPSNSVEIPTGGGTVDLTAAQMANQVLYFYATGDVTENVILSAPLDPDGTPGGWVKLLDLTGISLTIGHTIVLLGPDSNEITIGSAPDGTEVQVPIWVWMSNDATYLWGGFLEPL